MRTHPEPVGYYTPTPRATLSHSPYTAPTVLFVIPESQRPLYAGEHFTRSYAHSGGEALRHISSQRPRVVVVDWDEPELEAAEVCTSARAVSNTSLLVTTAAVENAPAILRAGCHGLLLKPFAPNLLAARLGRVFKETERPWGRQTLPAAWQTGTNRVWTEIACPKCGVNGATSFDFSSYRRMWYACLSCDHTWLGKRQE